MFFLCGATLVPMIASESLLTAQQVAVLLQVPKARVYELAREGLIPAVRLGRQIRVSASALDDWIADGGQALPDGWRRDNQPISEAEANRQ
jgi:excisionase family DNA binding protein